MFCIVYGKLTDNKGQNLANQKITIKVNGKTVKDTNGKVIYAKVVDSVATVEYVVPDNLSGKDVNITAVYSGSTKYNKESTTITKTVAAQEPTLTITPINDDVQTGSTITLKAKVASGDKAITTGKIVFKVNGKTVKDANGKVIYAHVDANGEVSIDYNLSNLKAGTYTIEATFIAPNYDKITSNTTMTVVKA
ncbi:MAG: Ig-like domain repeat protein [Methanosphaera stadtmanae]|nr:Ig-like domain repeat protein [Methanosphaera stadtmanae]